MTVRNLAINPVTLTTAADPVTRYERIDLGRARWWRKLGVSPPVTGQDILTQINAALAYVETLSSAATSRGVEIHLPYDNFTVSDTIHLYRPIRLIGASSGWDYGGTSLLWDESNTSALKTFIIVHNAFDDTSRGRGYGSHLQDLYLHGNTDYTGGSGPPGGYDDANPLYSGASADQVAIAGQGIEVRAQCTILRVNVTQAVYDAIHIATSDTETNCNLTRIYDSQAYSAGRHGMYLHGTNGNVIMVCSYDAQNNRRYGIYDRSQHGNIMVGCHTAGNAVSYYNEGGAINKTAWVACYAESDQDEGFCGYPGMVLGGTSSWGIGGATPSTGKLVNAAAPNWGVIDRGGNMQSWLSTPLFVYTRPAGGGTTSISANAYYPWGVVVDATTGDLLINLDAPATASIYGNQFIISRSDSSGNTVTIRTPSGTIHGGGTDLILTAGQTRTLAAITSLNQWRIISGYG